MSLIAFSALFRFRIIYRYFLCHRSVVILDSLAKCSNLFLIIVTHFVLVATNIHSLLACNHLARAVQSDVLLNMLGICMQHLLIIVLAIAVPTVCKVLVAVLFLRIRIFLVEGSYTFWFRVVVIVM
jgi:hypothetical protein